jgi:hypothetical protein
MAGEVSGGRGFAKRVDAGSYSAGADGRLDLTGAILAGCLRLEPAAAGWRATLTPEQ